MPYNGLAFRFSIQVGTAWRHEFPQLILRSTGLPPASFTGWAGSIEIRGRARRDEPGRLIATLAHAGTRDGDVLFEPDGWIALELPADFTAGLTPTHEPGRGKVRANVYGDLVLTDPNYPDDPYIAARGVGVISALTTTI